MSGIAQSPTLNALDLSSSLSPTGSLIGHSRAPRRSVENLLQKDHAAGGRRRGGGLGGGDATNRGGGGGGGGAPFQDLFDALSCNVLDLPDVELGYVGVCGGEWRRLHCARVD